MAHQLIEKLEENFTQYTKLIGRIKNEEVKSSLFDLVDFLKDRLPATPASTQTKYVGAYSGGLVEHSLNVALLSKKINEAIGGQVNTDSIILTSLFHDIGKVGTETEDYYIEKNSSWHNERGIMFELNESITDVPVAERSVWWLNKFKCPLTQDEISSILSLANVGHQTYTNQFYHAPLTTVVLQTAIRTACITGTGRTSVLR